MFGIECNYYIAEVEYREGEEEEEEEEEEVKNSAEKITAEVIQQQLIHYKYCWKA